MRLRRLQLDRLRRIDRAELGFGPGIHWLLGPNGSGKSSVLEGIALLASGRSFRSGSLDACIQRGANALTVFAEIETAAGGVCRIGLQRAHRGSFEGRIDGRPVRALSALFQAFPAVVFPADTGELIAGAGELRRRFVDWGLFHVEPDFLLTWRRYSRALRQRNLLLRQGQRSETEAAWREELAEHGLAVHRLRDAYIDALKPGLDSVAGWLMPECGAPRLSHRPGWPADRESYREALERQSATDRRQGFTGIGPHRAGWQLTFEEIPNRDMYSRGQAKLASLLMLLAQIAHFTEVRGEAPVVGLDDALAELDAPNQARLVSYLGELGAQAVLASADEAAVSRLAPRSGSVFHVKQGALRGPV